jgi:6-phosphogluconolactonase (cycloisomerase 2 family)
MGLAFALALVSGCVLASPALAVYEVPGSPFSTGSGPTSVVFSPGSDLLATANAGAATVSVFVVSPTGRLTPATGSPFPTGLASDPYAVAFGSDGRLLGVANAGTSTVSVFVVNPTTGGLSAVAGSPFATGVGPHALAFSPGGGLLATANAGASTVSVFVVDPTTGTLTPVSGSSLATGGDPWSIAFSPDGSLLATANQTGNSVSMFAVNQTTGALTAVTGSPFAVHVSNLLTESFASSVAFSPGGGLLATADPGSSAVSVFAVDQATGALTEVPASPFTFKTGTSPDSVAFSPVGDLLAATNGTRTVSVFAVDQATGLLTALPGSPLATGTGVSVAFSPGGGLLATANEDVSTVSMFSTAAPPITSISSPADGQTFNLNQLDD